MKRPSFGDASQGSNARPLFCLQHKQPWHTDLVTKRCAAEGCGKRGTYSDRPLTRRLPSQHLHPRPCAPGGRAAPGTRTEKRRGRSAGGVGGGDDTTEDECDRRGEGGEGGAGRGCGGGSSDALDAVVVGRCVQQKVRETVAIESREKGGERGEQEGVEAGASGEGGARASQDGGEASDDEARTSAALGRGGGGRGLLFCAKHRVGPLYVCSLFLLSIFALYVCSLCLLLIPIWCSHVFKQRLSPPPYLLLLCRPRPVPLTALFECPLLPARPFNCSFFFPLSLLNILSLPALLRLLCHSLCTPAPTPTSSPQKAEMVDVRHRKSSLPRDSKSLRRGGGGNRGAGIVGGEAQTQGHMKEGGNNGS
jgi:hypothetical protein